MPICTPFTIAHPAHTGSIRAYRRRPAYSGKVQSATYNTAQDYINALNADGQWITYDASTNTEKISSIAAFVQHCKTASKSVAAFDDLKRSQPENGVFGNDESDSLHFDSVLANLLAKNASACATGSGWDAAIVQAYANDLKALDKLGSDI